ncbi:MAG: hypothetical protein C4530_17915 [Desulfobacteraceae bacterium]|nr:MAG: hypothetical protein C4530_17915 [Desulfobacteraceae bacterium]
MRTVVFDSDVIEHEVKPHAKLSRFREMLALEVEQKLALPQNLHPCRCPGCSGEDSRPVFEKSKMTYRHCSACNSLYVAPRPADDEIVGFYRNSTAWRFWREQVLPETRETRREKIYYPRARWLLDVCDEYRPGARRGVAVGYHSELLLSELYRLEPGLFPIAVTNPIADIEWAGVEITGVSVRTDSRFDFKPFKPVDVLLAFDFLDRCSDVARFFRNAHEAIEPGGLMIAGTILTGFDVWVLWDRSDNIYPPDRLNVFSVEGLKSLAGTHGFEILELSTPGMFDTESVHRMVRAEPGLQWPRFARYLFENRENLAFSEFQEYLQKHRLSSFGRIVLRKAG